MGSNREKSNIDIAILENLTSWQGTNDIFVVTLLCIGIKNFVTN